MSASWLVASVSGRPDGILSAPLAGLGNAVLSAFSSWIITGTVALLRSLSDAVTATTTPDFGAGFSAELAEVGRIGAALAVPFLILAAIQAIVRQDLAGLLRAAFVRLPVAFLVGGAATELVSLLLGLTDECCNAIVGGDGASTRGLVSGLIGSLVGKGPHGALMSGFAGVVLALAATAVALVVWLELTVRAAAITVATLFLPLALAGLVWHATAHWARRLAETLAALVLSKLVIVAVLVLAARTMGSAPQGGPSATFLQGVALLLLAALSPFSLLRLLPMVEATGAAQLAGLSGRGMRFAAAGAGVARDGFERATHTGMHTDTPTGIDAIPEAKADMAFDDPRVEAEMRRLAARGRAGRALEDGER